VCGVEGSKDTHAILEALRETRRSKNTVRDKTIRYTSRQGEREVSAGKVLARRSLLYGIYGWSFFTGLSFHLL